MNSLIEKSISVEGLENAMKVAKTLIEQDYQVMVQYDDCDIYVVAYAYNRAYEYGSARFALISDEEEDMILEARNAAKDKDAKERVQSMINRGEVSKDDFDFDDENMSYDPSDEDDDRECGHDEEQY